MDFGKLVEKQLTHAYKDGFKRGKDLGIKIGTEEGYKKGYTAGCKAGRAKERKLHKGEAFTATKCTVNTPSKTIFDFFKTFTLIVE